MKPYLEDILSRSRVSFDVLKTTSTRTRNDALSAMAEALTAAIPAILQAKAEDVEAAAASLMTPALIDRLTLTLRSVRFMRADSTLARPPRPFSILPIQAAHRAPGTDRSVW